MSSIEKPSPLGPFSLSKLVSQLEDVADEKNQHEVDPSQPRTPKHHNNNAQTAQSLHIPGARHLRDTSSQESLFNNMSLVSPAFTPKPESFDAEDIRTHASAKSSRGLPDSMPKVFCESRARIPTTSGTEIFLHLYKNDQDEKEHLAIVFGQHIRSKSLFAVRPGETEHDRMTRGAYIGRLYPGRERSDSATTTEEGSVNEQKDTLVRIHSECYTGETAWSARCDCGEQLDEAARLMAQEGNGVIVYLRQEGRGIGLSEKLKAYNLQDLGADTVQANLMLRHPADGRSFGLATAILKDLGQDKIRLLTNNPDKITAVEGRNREITVTQRVPMVPLSWQNKGGFRSKEVNQYLKTKVERMGHILPISDLVNSSS